jgi:hypothetical protein
MDTTTSLAEEKFREHPNGLVPIEKVRNLKT